MLAVPCDEPNPDAPIAPHFGRARYFCIFDGHDRRIIENPGASAARRAGVLAANALVQQGVKVVFVKSIGPNSQRVLQAAGVEVRYTQAAKARDVIKELGL